ncbi:MAG: hypothetical protein AB1762_12460, partial [Gemmatimonadota bacterium]
MAERHYGARRAGMTVTFELVGAAFLGVAFLAVAFFGGAFFAAGFLAVAARDVVALPRRAERA